MSDSIVFSVSEWKSCMTNPHIGSTFDDFLRELGIYDELTAAAIEHVSAWVQEQQLAGASHRDE
jgi:hypothetical protein